MKVVCFDFDGVVIHSSEVQRYAFSESYYQVMGEVAGEEKIQEFFSMLELLKIIDNEY